MPDQALKPAKPYPEFPLTPHASGKWAKKIRGRIYYFGRWHDADGALREYNAVKGDLHAGREPTLVAASSCTVKDLFNKFLARQLARVDAGRLDPRSFADTKGALSDLAKAVGPGRIVADLRPVDFRAAREAYSKGRGPHTVNRYVANVKAAFNYGIRDGAIGGPVLYGDEFGKEPIKVQRRAARERAYTRGGETFTPDEVRKILKHATGPLRAMVLLGLNAGFYGIDVAKLPMKAIDLDDAWLEFPRPKTEVMRAAPLWPETIEALAGAVEMRPKPTNPADAGLLFLTTHGRPWIHDKVHRGEGTITKVSRTNAVNQAFTKLLDKAKVRRKGINFAALRDTFVTIANESGDQNASLLIRGHSFPGMDAFYVKAVVRERLETVVNHVHDRLLKTQVVRPRARPKPRNRRRNRAA